MKKDKHLPILIKAAQAGGRILRKYFGQALNITEKSTVADFQTTADLQSEKAILKILKKAFPKYNILAEEGGKTDKNSEYTFVIDPLDGTHNFILGIPDFCVSVALLRDDKPVAGVIYSPILDRTYYAVKNGGAYLNGKKIKVNKVTDSDKLTISLGFGYETDQAYVGEIMKSFMIAKHNRIKNNWSAVYDLSILASGKIESIFCDGWELHDFAAGKLIALEAGAKIIDFTGKKETNHANRKFIISNSEKVNKYVLSIIKPLQRGMYRNPLTKV